MSWSETLLTAAGWSMSRQRTFPPDMTTAARWSTERSRNLTQTLSVKGCGLPAPELPAGLFRRVPVPEVKIYGHGAPVLGVDLEF